MAKLPKKLAAALLAIVVGGGGYHEMTQETVKYVEGIERYPYSDVAGNLTVCYGHTGPDIELRTYTDTECEALLESDLKPVYAALKALVAVPLTAYQRTALATFVYNCGVGNFSRSTLLKKLNAGDFTGAHDEMARWVFSGGHRWKGLMNRRQIEQAIFNVRGPDDFK